MAGVEAVLSDSCGFVLFGVFYMYVEIPREQQYQIYMNPTNSS